MGGHAYAVTNLAASLVAGSFVVEVDSAWAGYTGSDRTYLGDGRMDKRVSVGLTSGGNKTGFRIDLGSAQSVAGIAILNHNIVTTGQGADVTVRGATDSGFTTGVVASKSSTTMGLYLSNNTREPQNKDHVYQFAAVSKRYWEIEFTPYNDVNMAVGEVFVFGAPTVLTRKGIYGSSDGVKLYTSEMEFGNGDTRSIFYGGPVLRKTLRWQDFDDDERDELRRLFLTTRGNASPLLFINSYEATSTAAAATEQDVIYGRLSGLDDLEYSEMDYGLFQINDFTVRSLGREIGA